jgi:hypothetical protein
MCHAPCWLQYWPAVLQPVSPWVGIGTPLGLANRPSAPRSRLRIPLCAFERRRARLVSHEQVRVVVGLVSHEQVRVVVGLLSHEQVRVVRLVLVVLHCAIPPRRGMTPARNHRPPRTAPQRALRPFVKAPLRLGAACRCRADIRAEFVHWDASTPVNADRKPHETPVTWRLAGHCQRSGLTRSAAPRHTSSRRDQGHERKTRVCRLYLKVDARTWPSV